MDNNLISAATVCSCHH